jgi:hypothetical protein
MSCSTAKKLSRQLSCYPSEGQESAGGYVIGTGAELSSGPGSKQGKPRRDCHRKTGEIQCNIVTACNKLGLSRRSGLVSQESAITAGPVMGTIQEKEEHNYG